MPSEDTTIQALNTINAYWEAGCGSVLFCFVTFFAIKVQRFYGEVGQPKVVHIQETSNVPRRRRVVSLMEDGG
ncbi:hypothetical protein [Dictyobacter alpinus]|nr:hypothetical protein [Dictyobacter alpinus]